MRTENEDAKRFVYIYLASVLIILSIMSKTLLYTLIYQYEINYL